MDKIDENLDNLSISEQRENLLKLNPDLLFWVYWLKNSTDKEIDLEFKENLLTCYANQLENIKWLEENPDITILDLMELRKWKIKVLVWNLNTEEEKNLLLLSNWRFELVEAKNNKEYIKKRLKWFNLDEELIKTILDIHEEKELEEAKNEARKILEQKWINKHDIEKILDFFWRYHIVSTLRDWGAADKKQRTWIAWRNSWKDLKEDLEREVIEESPFIWYDENWNFALATSDTSEESQKILIESIQRFLERKYLKKWDENYEYVKKNFERNFPWIKYDDLGDILKDIIENKRFYTYKTESIKNIEWMEKSFKKIKLWNSEIDAFVYWDEKNNTIEYREAAKIKWFQEWFKPLSKRCPRLYLESENQYSKTHRIENTNKDWFVPANKAFAEEYSKRISWILYT